MNDEKIRRAMEVIGALPVQPTGRQTAAELLGANLQAAQDDLKRKDAEIARLKIKADNFDAICASVQQGPRILRWDSEQDMYSMQEYDEAGIARLRQELEIVQRHADEEVRRSMEMAAQNERLRQLGEDVAGALRICRALVALRYGNTDDAGPVAVGMADEALAAWERGKVQP